MGFSYGLQRAIAQEIGMRYGINEEDFDWFVMNIRVKRADMQQRHRFADTIRKLEVYLQARKAEPDYDEDEPIFITVSEAAQITGRNRKTIADWNRKDLLVNDDYDNKKWINVEQTIEKLKNFVKISR